MRPKQALSFFLRKRCVNSHPPEKPPALSASTPPLGLAGSAATTLRVLGRRQWAPPHCPRPVGRPSPSFLAGDNTVFSPEERSCRDHCPEAPSAFLSHKGASWLCVQLAQP